MAYVAYVTKLKNLRPHPNADRLQLAEAFGNTVCVGLDYTSDMLVAYFPTDGQLSEKFCEVNNLVRKKGPNGENIGGYMDPDKRNVTTIRLRGEKSDGLALPLSCLDYCYPDINGGAAMMLNEGDTIDVVNGNEICQKYIPMRKTNENARAHGNHVRKKKAPIAPLFVEHADTEQLAYNLDSFKPGDHIEITLKMHGTSQRTGYLPVLKGYKRTFMDRILRREGTPIYDWGYVTGTRRVVLDNFDGGFYGSNKFREDHAKKFEGKLWKGETVYLEICGWINETTPIMPSAKNKLVGKDFVKKYGDTTIFHYGCENGASECYVYRMTMTNEDGDVVEYSPEFMRYRCEQMGVKYVPVLWSGVVPEHPASQEDSTISYGEWVKNVAERFFDGVDPIGKTHIKEGVVVRIVNRSRFTAFKHKNFDFKCLSGIAIAEIENTAANFSDDLLSEM